MELDELKERIDALLNPEPDEDLPHREFSHPRLAKEYGIDTSYLETTIWEGSTIHPHTRLCSPDDGELHTLTRNSDVSLRLFEAGLRLFADSIVAYHGDKERKGQLRYYPPVILTFWSGFETFVRYASELMLITVKNVPEPIAHFLRDQEAFVDDKAHVNTRGRNHRVLHRYAVLLARGYGFQVDRGAPYWQRLEQARELRDYYTHLDVTDPRGVSSRDVLRFTESVLLALIWPSALIKRTLMLGIYHMYWQWAEISELATYYVEQPFFKDWYLQEGYQFHCNFDNVDDDRFPGSGNRLRVDEILSRMKEVRDGQPN